VPEIAVQLSDQQMHDLELMAKFHGVSASDLASAAFSASLSEMYALPSSGGTVTEIKGLFPASRGPKA
jgi:hypothetical protein